MYSWAVALDLRKYTVTAQPHRNLLIVRRLVYTVADVATQMRLLSSYGKALNSLLMTEHNLNEPINNYKKKYTMCCLGLSDCERPTAQVVLAKLTLTYVRKYTNSLEN